MSYLLLSCSFCLFVLTFCWCLIGFRLSLSVYRFLSAACCFSRVIDYWLGMAICDLLRLFRSPIFYCHPWLLYCYQLYCQLWKPFSCQSVHSLHANPFSRLQFVVASVGSSSNFAKWLPGSADGVLLVSSALADAAFVCAAIAPGSGLACAPSPVG